MIYHYVSVSGHVEVVDMKVTVCRDAVKGKCVRPLCKYYHIPILLPPANEMAQLEDQGYLATPNSVLSTNHILCQQIFGFNS